MRGCPLFLGLLGLGVLACREPTQIRVEILKDFPCPENGMETGLTMGVWDKKSQNVPTSSRSENCPPGDKDELVEIGSVVITPRGSKDGEVAFEVVTGYKVTLDSCLLAGAQEKYSDPEAEQGCIWSPRVGYFIPHKTTVVRVQMRFNCLNVSCDQVNEVCVNGTCVDRRCDPDDTYCDKELGIGGTGPEATGGSSNGGSAGSQNSGVAGSATGGTGGSGSSGTQGLSCEEDPRCGVAEDDSCCLSPAIDTAELMPAGMDSGDSYSVTDGSLGQDEQGHEAQLSAFYLDKYEVTVSRFRPFYRAVTEENWRPPTNAGAHPMWPDTGWQESFPFSSEGLLDGCSEEPTFTEAVEDNEKLPVNCVDWYTAFAFCIWDNGRLPTEHEWEYAAAGGEENWVFPLRKEDKGDPDVASEANYDDGPGSLNRLVAVGQMTGEGRWTHRDLAGNVGEWVFDVYDADYYTNFSTTPCNDCVNGVFTTGDVRSIRGGDYRSAAQRIRSASRGQADPTSRDPGVGIRCARDE